MKKYHNNFISNNNFYMILFIISMAFFYLILVTIKSENKPSEKIIIKNSNGENPNSYPFWFPSWPYTNAPINDPLINPYNPPLKDERYFISNFNAGLNPGFNGIPLGSVPINISTSIGAVDTVYRQLGILTPVKGSSKDSILPLMGRPLFTNRDKWNYYTTSNQHNNVKLPLIHKGKSCTNEYGCDRIFSNDIVYIEGVNERYKVTMYDNNVIRYLPAI